MSFVFSPLAAPTRALACLMAVLLGAACSSTAPEADAHDEASSTSVSALSAAQCDYFAVNGKVRICHATGSAKNPFTVLNVSDASCVLGHAGHARDYVAVNDPNCGGNGYLPPGAPCDATLPCSEGFTCRTGACEPTDRCAGVVCNASDQCHVAYCNPDNGLCVDEPKVNDFPCDDANACTRSDTCQAGACLGADPVVCEASDQCHDAGTCNTATGVCSVPAKADGSACTDGDTCTATDTCEAGACTGADPLAAGAGCSDDDAYTESDACNGTGRCVGSVRASDLPATGGTVVLREGKVGLVVPEGAVPGAAGVTITAVLLAEYPDETDAIIPGTAWELGPDGIVWEKTGVDFLDEPESEVKLTLAYDPQAVPEGAEEALVLVKLVDGAWELQEASYVDPASHTVTAIVDGFSKYAIKVPLREEPPMPVKVSKQELQGPGDKGKATVGKASRGSALEFAYSEPEVLKPQQGKFKADLNGTTTLTTKMKTYDKPTKTVSKKELEKTKITVKGARPCKPTSCAEGGDQCNASSCDAGTGECVVNAEPDGLACNDGDACTTVDRCRTGACSGRTVRCSAMDQCHTAGTCSPATGLCSDPVAPATTVCADQNASTYADHCDGAGSCTGTTVTCPAATACTSYVANGTATCTAVHAPTTTSCNDGSVTTFADRCDGAGGCGGTPVVCPAATACSSYEANGTDTCTVTHAAAATSCNDASPLTHADRCDGAGACFGTPVVCPAATACTSYSANGTATCTVHHEGTATSCSDASTATYADRCDGTGSCVGTPVACPANTPCTSYSANGTSSCTVTHATTSVSCSDASASTYADHCDGSGSCVGTAVSCPANTPCTSYSANGTSSCTVTHATTSVSCSDASASTYEDHCDGSGSCVGTAVSCPANTQCTSYSANGTSTCSANHAALNVACDDASASTYADRCDGTGACAGSAITCPANTQCTTYSPNGTATCAAAPRPSGTACNDANACTRSDTCQAGACVGANPVTCAASDQCHVAGSCNTATGTCSNPVKPNGSACGDGNACTQTDTCQAGTCTGSNPVTCPAPDVNLVVNGSFEQGNYAPIVGGAWVEVGTSGSAGASAVTGWHVAGIADWHNTAQMTPAADGGKTIDLEHGGMCHGGGRAVLSQNIATTPGAQYRLSFFAAGPTDGSSCSGPPLRHVRATTAGMSTDFAVNTSWNMSLQWERKEVVFTATGSTTQIAFSSPDGDLNGYWGTVLDLVSVVSVDAECRLPGTCVPQTGACTAPSAPAATACDDGLDATESDMCTATGCTGCYPNGSTPDGGQVIVFGQPGYPSCSAHFSTSGGVTTELRNEGCAPLGGHQNVRLAFFANASPACSPGATMSLSTLYRDSDYTFPGTIKTLAPYLLNNTWYGVCVYPNTTPIPVACLAGTTSTGN